MTISTHVLDSALGVPAAGIAVVLYACEGAARCLLASVETNVDGRTAAPLATDVAPGMYELVFSVAAYFARTQTPSFYDEIAIRFQVTSAERSYHVPLLLAPWSYATYRGS